MLERSARSQEPMKIWRDIFIENCVGDEALAAALADALVAPGKLIEIKRGGGMWSDTPRDMRVEIWPAHGQYCMMAALFVLRDQAAFNQLDDRTVLQALADRLGCAVLLPDETVLSLPIYLCFRPGAAPDKVELDPGGLDERPPRVAVSGPAPLDADGQADYAKA